MLMFSGTTFDLCGDLYASQHDVRSAIASGGGKVVNLKNEFSSTQPKYILSGKITLNGGDNPKLLRAQEANIPILDSSYVKACTAAGTLLNTAPFQLWPPVDADTAAAASLSSPSSPEPASPVVSNEPKGEPGDAKSRVSQALRKLPAWTHRAAITKHIQANSVSIIAGPTGCGKSAIVPQLILDEGIVEEGKRIVCTQAGEGTAVALATYIAEQRGEEIGGDVGYTVRFKNQSTSESKLVFVPSPIFVRHLQVDPQLTSTGCLIIDEVHQRDTSTDLILLVVKDLLLHGSKGLKLVVLCSDITASALTQYLMPLHPGGLKPIFCSGGQSMVSQYYLEDAFEWIKYTPPHDSEPDAGEWDAVVANLAYSRPGTQFSPDTLRSLCLWKQSEVYLDLVKALVLQFHASPTTGAMLVYLPGVAEISALRDMLMVTSPTLMAIALHSSTTSEEIAEAFLPAPAGLRKVILATAMAETSAAIPDVVYVIDGGLLTTLLYDPSMDTSEQLTTTITKASAPQRSGRSSWQANGAILHLFPSYMFAHLPESPVPDMQTKPLEETVLAAKVLQIGNVGEVLSSALSPPGAESMANAVANLQAIHAFDSKGEVTSLGETLNLIPLAPKISKFVLWGAMLRCIKPVAVIAAFLTIGSPYQNPTKKPKIAESGSDHYYWLKVYTGFQESRSAEDGNVGKYCLHQGLNKDLMEGAEGLVTQIVKLMLDAGYDGTEVEKGNVESYCKLTMPQDHEWDIIKCALVGGFYPNICAMAALDEPEATLIDPNGEMVELMPSSLVSAAEDCTNVKWVVYTDKVRKDSQQVCIQDVTPISGTLVLLFCNILWAEAENVYIDKWLLNTVTEPPVPWEDVYEFRTNIMAHFKNCVEAKDFSLFPDIMVDEVAGYISGDIDLQQLSLASKPPPQQNNLTWPQ